MAFLTGIVVGTVLGLVAHLAAIARVGKAMEQKTFLDFMTDMKSHVRFCIAFVLAVWLIAGPSSHYFILYMIGYFVTFLMVDYSSVEQYYTEGKPDL